MAVQGSLQYASFLTVGGWRGGKQPNNLTELRWALSILVSGWRVLHQHVLSNEQKNCLFLTASAGFLASILQAKGGNSQAQYFVLAHCAYSAQKIAFSIQFGSELSGAAQRHSFWPARMLLGASREQQTHLTPYFYFTTTISNPDFIGWSALRFFSTALSPFPYWLPLFSHNPPATAFLPTGLLFFKRGCTFTIHLFSNQTADFNGCVHSPFC